MSPSPFFVELLGVDVNNKVIAEERLFGIIMMVISIVAVAMAVYTGIQTREYAQCQAEVNEMLINAQNARAQVTEQDRDAIDQLVSDVLQATKPGESRTALERYRETRATNDAERNANPLPAPPSQTCG